jgi:hypothetical protein
MVARHGLGAGGGGCRARFGVLAGVLHLVQADLRAGEWEDD